MKGAAAGFTLLELMVVLSILGLILALTPISLSIVVPGQRLRSAASILADDLREARNRSVLSGRTTELVIDLQANSYRIGEDGKPKPFPDGTAVSVEEFSVGKVDPAKAIVGFFPDGSASGGRIDLRAGGRHYLVAVNWLTGRVTVDD